MWSSLTLTLVLMGCAEGLVPDEGEARVTLKVTAAEARLFARSYLGPAESARALREALTQIMPVSPPSVAADAWYEVQVADGTVAAGGLVLALERRASLVAYLRQAADGAAAALAFDPEPDPAGAENTVTLYMPSGCGSYCDWYCGAAACTKAAGPPAGTQCTCGNSGDKSCFWECAPCYAGSWSACLTCYACLFD